MSARRIAAEDRFELANQAQARVSRLAGVPIAVFESYGVATGPGTGKSAKLQAARANTVLPLSSK